MEQTPATERNASRRRDFVVAGACGAFAAMMVGMAYAAVPLYDWFCRTTGFAGTPKVATSAPAHAMERKVIVRFDANVTGGLPWRFVPEKPFVEVRIGEVFTVNYLVTNQSARATVGQASYNVSPSTVGSYFAKINCFCFTEQELRPGETREMPVVFFVEPDLAKDSEHDRLNTITLSYTMFPVRRSEPQRVGSTATDGKGRL